MKTYNFNKSQELFKRAAQVIPCGIYGHQSPAPLVPPTSYPFYIDRAKGARFWDADGNEFIDYMCAYGPMVLGYGYEPVDTAARAQAQAVDCATAPAPVMVELAEFLVDLIPAAEWAFFAKNGGDVTSYALMIARAATGRKKVVLIKGGYHGVAPWAQLPGNHGLTEEDYGNCLRIGWNDLQALEEVVERYPDQIAGFMATPYHHPAFADSELPAEGYWTGVEALCRRKGIVLIIDDVRCGFRLDLRGSNEYFGFKPDLICLCKALANGHPISALVGSEALKGVAAKVFYTGSYWFSAGPMAAALATLKDLKRLDGPGLMAAAGQRLTAGLKDLARAHGFNLKVTGHPAMPFLRLTDDESLMLHQAWCGECTRRGAYFTSHHNWFLSTAHTDEDIDQTLEIANQAFKAIKERL